MKPIELKYYDLLTRRKEADIVNRKIGGERPIGLGTEDQLERRVDARPVLTVYLQRHPAASG